MNETENSDTAEHATVILKPHTRADFVRVGWVILMASLPIAGLGYRFFHQHLDTAVGSQNFAAALMFWFIALMLLSVSVGILVKTRRMPRD